MALCAGSLGIKRKLRNLWEVLAVGEEIESNPSTAGANLKGSGFRMTDDQIWASAVSAWEVAAKEISRLAISVDKERFAQWVEAFAACRGRVVTMGMQHVGSSCRQGRALFVMRCSRRERHIDSKSIPKPTSRLSENQQELL